MFYLGVKKVQLHQFQLEIPTGYEGKIEGRSGLALRSGISPMAGVIDSDFRGNIGITFVHSNLIVIIQYSRRDFEQLFGSKVSCSDRGQNCSNGNTSD